VNISTFLESWSGGELDIASYRYGQLEIAILHGDLEQIATWVEAPGVQVNVHGAKVEIPSWLMYVSFMQPGRRLCVGHGVAYACPVSS
jgi:hypothetical protein